MSLRDPHVKGALRKAFKEVVEPGPGDHGGRDGAYPLILFRQGAHGLPKGLGEVTFGGLDRLTGLQTEPAHAVEPVRIALGRCIAFPLYSKMGPRVPKEADRASCT